MKRKNGISLIVLVITIIVMIILAATVVISLSQNGIIGKANEAVDTTNLKQVQQAAMLAWADAYAGGEREVDDLKDAVDNALEAANVDVSKYEITVTTNGVTVVVKETTTPPVEEPDEDDDTTPTQLVAPTVALSGDTLTITDNAENGSYTAGFEVYVGEEKKAAITASSQTTFDLTTLELAAGTYSITVKSVAAEDSTITASEASETVSYVVAEETADENGGWELQKTVDETSGKVTEVKVTKGTQSLDVGTPVNYMTSGVGDTNYTGGWKILGVDDQGRLLIMSSASITGSKIGLSGTTGYLNALTTLQTTVDSYKDGTLGVEVRSVKVEDIDALTSFAKTTYGEGTMYAYGNEVTYTWDGSDKPAYIYGTMTTPNNLTGSHSSKGFTYYDVASGEIVTSEYTTTAGTAITTLKSDYYNYTGSSYLADTTPAYKMIFRNADDTANADTYWLASRDINTSSYRANFGVRYVGSGSVSVYNLFYSSGDTSSPSYAARAVVTLASDIQVTESTTAGTYDLTLAQ